jgi:hypothetical protein
MWCHCQVDPPNSEHSDILAELDLPASGISRAESRISLPKGRFTLPLQNEISAPSTMMMFYYSSQIHLRKVLNRVHTDLYKVESKAPKTWPGKPLMYLQRATRIQQCEPWQCH